ERALEQAQPQRVLERAVAVLAIGQQGHAAAGIGQVDPALGGHFERRGFPARIAMGRPIDAPELDLVGRSPIADPRRKCDLEQSLALLPVDIGDEVDARRASVHAQALGDARALAEAPPQLENDAFWPAFDDLDTFELVDLARLLHVEHVDIPGIPLDRPVLEDDQPIAQLALGQDVAAARLVEYLAEAATVVEADVPERRLAL